jgi:hypothetical protein
VLGFQKHYNFRSGIARHTRAGARFPEAALFDRGFGKRHLRVESHRGDAKGAQVPRRPARWMIVIADTGPVNYLISIGHIISIVTPMCCTAHVPLLPAVASRERARCAVKDLNEAAMRFVRREIHAIMQSCRWK